MRAWDLAMSLQWAITDDALQTMLEVASRENLTPEAVEAQLGRPLENTERVTVRDGVATIPITGPIFRRANLLTRVSGATSIEVLATDFHSALDDPQVASILFRIDSPGGEANGVSEFAQMVHEVRGRKPIVAYIGGSGTSGAYWIASAAEEVIVADTAIVGSVGAILAIERRDDAKKQLVIVSSQSPRKYIDAETKQGRAQLQDLIDSLADVFISSVARYRGVDRETVLSDYGQGGIMLGEQAVEAGLVDRVSTYEAVHAELVSRTDSASRWGAPAAGGHIHTLDAKEIIMAGSKIAEPAAENSPAITVETIAADYPQIAEHFRAEGRSEATTKERERILSIQGLPAIGQEALIAECVSDPECTPEAAALKVLQAARDAEVSEGELRKAALRARQLDEEELDPPAAVAVDPVSSAEGKLEAEVNDLRAAAQRLGK